MTKASAADASKCLPQEDRFLYTEFIEYHYRYIVSGKPGFKLPLAKMKKIKSKNANIELMG
ncbi:MULTISPECIES: hypothetical protein [Undibacterium]|uniref:Uncharacterized protein n=1 Tax=Undibacterium umbellatum TaxID=2762300 RepID=A0ABR6Z8L5_9BURK|nr:MULTISPECIES: hypothetical protein [Undibacterium]MBC3908113.1 hypothetical protein [Undibacterium umbellatum]MDP1978973.1 hypothetical protein [Undibacterium sp.]